MTAGEHSHLPWWRRLRRRLYYWLLLVILWLVSLLPMKAGRWSGRNLARLGASLRPGDCQRALSNLALAFPELDNPSRQRIFKDSVVSLGENFFDTLATPALLEKNDLVMEELVQGEASLVDEIKHLAQGGKGVLVLTGHLGCWELLGAWVAREMAPAGMGSLGVVTGSIHNAPVDRLIQNRRRKLGMTILPREQGAAPLLRHLKSGGVVAVLLDQNTRVENIPIPFFGQDAPTPVGMARIALRAGVPILPVVMARQGDRHVIRRSEAWLPAPAGSENHDSLEDILVWCNRSLENFIRRNPKEWVWFHKRWS